MSRWFRVYDDAINDPKILKLPEATRWHWIAVLCIASKNDGVIPATEDVAISLRVKATAAAAILAGLKNAGLLDLVEGRFVPHNWDGRQFKSDTSNDRVKRYRQRKCNVTETVTVTPPETEQIQNTETEAEKKDPPLRSDDWPKDFGDVFWAAYPRKTEKLSAMKKLAAIRKSGVVTFSDLMAGVRRYAASGTEPQYTKHPTTWLNAGCWSDEIQTGGGRGQRTANSGTARSDAILAAAAREAGKIIGDGEMAGSAVETELSFGDGSYRGTARGYHGSAGEASAGNDGRKPVSGSVLEGEIISPDETDARLPGGWRVVG